MVARRDRTYDAVVIGAGPGGLAATCALLDRGAGTVGWVDKSFGGGRLNGMYREIPSNTKIHIYIDALATSSTCQQVIKDTPKPNAVTALEDMDQESTCHLAAAGDMVMMLQEGLLKTNKVDKILGQAVEVERVQDVWKVTVGDDVVSAHTVVLATGSYPKSASFHEKFNDKLEVIDLDTSLRPSVLPPIFDKTHDSSKPPQVSIIGNSHSAILVVRNCYALAKSSIPGLKVKLFERRPLVYAEYRDDGIVHDNTGLKGTTAEWAKQVLDSGKAEDVIERVHLPKDGEEGVYEKYLPSQTHLVYAIGYARSPLPKVVVDGKRVDSDLVFDMHSSGFSIGAAGKDGGAKRDQLVPGLYGCGIAFPEEVEDPAGNVEAAVGVAKFFKFAERVGKDWLREE